MKNQVNRSIDLNYKLLQIVRKQKGYTLQMLEDLSGVPFQRISDIEYG